ncbi:MAG: TetR/AcrR family transcriptional regulator [Spirochaetaceae bacterium]|nr:TetR/AcrR family transcriptional regulator [Spirochaetaceae bacterium]
MSSCVGDDEAPFAQRETAELLSRLEGAGIVSRTFLRLDAGKRSLVVEAVLSELAERGPEAASIKSVAARAGVPVGSLYQYFADRDAMVRAACALAAAGLVAELDCCRVQMAGLDLRAGFEAYLYEGLAWAESRPVLLKVFALAAYRDSVTPRRAEVAEAAPDGDGGRDARADADADADWADSLVAPVAAAFRSVVRALLDGAAARGELAPELDLELATRLANALLIAICDSELLPGLDRYYGFHDGTYDRAALARGAAAFIAKALAPAGGRGPGGLT